VRARAGIATSFICVIGLALSAQTADPQGSSASDCVHWSRWEIGSYIGVARNSPGGHRFGLLSDRDHLFLGIRASRTLAASRRVAFGYAPDVVLLLLSNNPRYRSFTTADGQTIRFEAGDGLVAGVGVSPVGLEGKVRLGRRWDGYGAGAMGGVWFTREVPGLYARKFNYTLEGGGGLRWHYRSGSSLRVGYTFHHLSNADTALANPGVDGNVFIVGFDQALGQRK
jgi:Lipid A 3-O-deacylase (PagL)